VVAVQENKLAVLFQQRGELEQARVHHERALAIRRATYGPHHQLTGESLNNLGLTLHLLGRPAEAEPLYREALAAFDAALGAGHPDTASVWNNLGIVLRERGEWKEARSCIERGIAVKEGALGPLHPGLAQLLSNLAELAILEGDTGQARALYARSLDIVEASARRALGLLQGQERLALAESVRWLLQRRLAAAAALGDSGYAEVLRFKGLVGRLERAERKLFREGGSELAARFDALAAAHRRLAALANARVPRREAERHAAWQESYAKAAADVDRLAGALAAERGGAGAAPALATSVEELGRALGDAVLVDILRTGSTYVAWVVRRDARIVRVDLGPAQPIEEAADALAGTLASASTADAWQDAAKRLAALAWTPLEPHLGDAPREIYLSPDAVLGTVPVELLAPASRSVRHVTMAQDVIGAAPAARSGGGLYVGAVDFGRPEDGADPSGRPRIRFPALPGTRAEVEALAALEGDGARVLLGAAATEAALRHDAKGRRVIHVATHGFVRGDLAQAFRPGERNDLSRTGTEELHLIGYDPRVLCGLALAGANMIRGGESDDGILTALEAAALDLDACDLVVLSACETAGGTVRSGEGVLGLVQAMQVAGARCVVASLWKVDDDATRALMTRFYELRSAKDVPPVAAALRSAQEHVRREPRWAHPFYWAAWVSWERRG
jgi:Tfp pilus assembly protein PilF